MKRVKNSPPPVTVECPACKAPCTIEEADLEVGDVLICDQCDEALTVVTVSPLVLQVDDPDEDDDLDDDDDEDEDEDEDDGLNDDDDEG